MKLTLSSNATRIIVLLIATDFVFIYLHIFHKLLKYEYLDTGGLVNFSGLFFLSRDRGYPEIFQYIKEYWIALLLGWLAWKNRSFLYLSWTSLFTYILLDDSLRIHEDLGALLSNNLRFISAFRLRSVDFGEILVSAFFGVFFLILIAIAYRFSNRIDRQICRYLILFLFALACFGIVTDMIHVMARSQLKQELIELIEDGGEHLIMSLITGFVYFVSEQSERNTRFSESEKVTEMLFKN